MSKDMLAKLEKDELWLQLIPKDPRKFLLEQGESFTIYRTLIDLLALPESHPAVKQAKKELLRDPLVLWMLDHLSDWENDTFSGHDKPDYLPNQIWLLLDWGLTPDDEPRIRKACEQMLNRQDKDSGQFLAHSWVYDGKTKEKYAAWTSAMCDHLIIVSVLALAGYIEDPRLQRGFDCVTELLKETDQGMGWKCETWINNTRRGPGRKDEVCPILIVDALKGFWVVPENFLPPKMREAGLTLLNCWTKRSTEKPYMFGHGREFRKLKPPFFWYNLGTVLDAASHYPHLVKTQAFREMAAVSRLAFNSEGLVIPQAIKIFFKDFSFGQKKQPSPWVTFFLCRIYRRALEWDKEFVSEVLKLDGASYRGSKGGIDKKKPPKKSKTTKKRNPT